MSGRPARGRHDVVHVEPLGPSFDLLAAADRDACWFEHRGLGIAAERGGEEIATGSGERSLLEAGGEALAILRSGDRGVTTPPVALGAVGFGASGGALFVPHRVVRRTEPGRTALVERRVAGDDPPPFEPTPVRTRVPRDALSDLQLVADPTPAAYADAVRTATARIHAGDLRKVVLARRLEVRTGRPVDPVLLAARLRSVDPDAYAFVAPTRRGVLVGASPELLLSRRGRDVRSNPLAGSAPRSGDPEEDRRNGRELEASSKNREEHGIVVEAVAEILGPLCERLEWDREPVLLATANVWHLSTRFRGTLRDPAPHALELVAALHPTPAVGGAPRAEALAAIEGLEPFDRGAYAGPVGWIDADGDGEWAIALRCAEIEGDRATLYAGAGIVDGSDPSAEVEETDRKFRAFLDALRWG